MAKKIMSELQVADMRRFTASIPEQPDGGWAPLQASMPIVLDSHEALRDQLTAHGPIIDAVAKGPTRCGNACKCEFCGRHGWPPKFLTASKIRLTHPADCPVTLARKIKGLTPENITEC